MFDLNQQLSNWRKRLIESNVYSSADVEELEAHILDAMDNLQSKGLNQEEAFCVAIHQVGDMEDLNKEFGKINQNLIWKRRIIWLLAGYFIVRAINYMIGAIPSLVLLLGLMGGAKISLLIVIYAILGNLLMVSVIFLIFSGKIRNSSVATRIINFARNHYVRFMIAGLTIFFVILALNLLVENFAFPKINGLDGHSQVMISNLKSYFVLLRQIFLIASLTILVMLMRRSKSPRAL